MLTFPNAKINIGLQIIEKRGDGFHNINSVFYPIGWKDALEIVPAQELSFTSSGLEIPGKPENNLCLKAFELLKTDFDIPNVHIHLHKAIPMGAGMGGGSADGAFTLKMLNELFGLQLSNETLENYAKKLGSDCAFFIQNIPKFCFEKGDHLLDFDFSLKHKFIYVVNPIIHISTAEAYGGVRPKLTAESLMVQLTLPIERWKDRIVNDFEVALLSKYPEIQTIKNQLYDLGAKYASMTGSGSTVYGIFDFEPKISNIFENYDVWIGELN